MEKKENEVNIGFFKKIWYSITKFEQYPAMSAEGVGNAIKYLLILTIIVTIFAMIGSLLKMNKLVNNIAQYIEQNIPEFTYSDGKVAMEIEQPIIIENIQYNGINKIVINPTAETDEQKEQSQKDETIVGTTIFFFKDNIILKSKVNDEQVIDQQYTYSDFITNYTGENIATFNKSELVEYLTSQKMTQFYARYGSSIFLYLLVFELIGALLNTLEIAILGWITSRCVRIKMKFTAIYSMAIYSLTLSIFLNILYMVINYFTSFTITYFQVAYITIAYIYLIATIFILKDDLIKKMQEVEKIKKEQEKVKEEIKEQEEKKEKPKEKDDEEKKEKKEDDEGDEPQGSEA